VRLVGITQTDFDGTHRHLRGTCTDYAETSNPLFMITRQRLYNYMLHLNKLLSVKILRHYFVKLSYKGIKT